MRFSSVFQLHAVPHHPAAPASGPAPVQNALDSDALDAKAVQPAAPVPPAPGQDLPDDLDARVRLIGEWQLGEGY